jgi:hypothetical protein
VVPFQHFLIFRSPFAFPGASLSNLEGSHPPPGNPFQRAHIRPFNSPQRDPPRASPTRASDALTSPEGLADVTHAPWQQGLYAAQQAARFGGLERGSGGLERLVNPGGFGQPPGFGFPGRPLDPGHQRNSRREGFVLPNQGVPPVGGARTAPGNAESRPLEGQTWVKLDMGRDLSLGRDEGPALVNPKPNPETPLLPTTPAGEDVEPNPVLESSGEGDPPNPEPLNPDGGLVQTPQEPVAQTRPGLVPNVHADSQVDPRPGANNEGSLGTKSSSPSLGVVPDMQPGAQQPEGLRESLGEGLGEGLELPRGGESGLQQALAREENGLSAHLVNVKPSKPLIQSMPQIDLPEAGQALLEREPPPFRPFVTQLMEGSKAKRAMGVFGVIGKAGQGKGVMGNREVALEQAARGEEGAGFRGMGKRTASKGAWLDRLMQQATGTAVKKTDGVGAGDRTPGGDGKGALMLRESMHQMPVESESKRRESGLSFRCLFGK